MTISDIKANITKIINMKKNTYKFLVILGLIITLMFSYYFMSNNDGQYKKTIAKITKVTNTMDSQEYGINGGAENIYAQRLRAVIMNGVHKGEEIQLQNTTSYSQTLDQDYKVNDKIFISITEGANKKIVSTNILNFKRDKYLVYIIGLFIVLIILIGGYKGLRSLASVIINISIFILVIMLYIHGWNLVWVAAAASIFFVILSIFLVSGINKKAGAAIIGTMAGTMIAMLITIIVIRITHSNGINYESMEFAITSNYEQVFIIEVLIGTLGGIMDIAISISSAVKAIYDMNPDIERKMLIKSGREIGKDIMGTMANTLLFAYISGSIPMILLLMKNGYSIFNIINFNISLEIIRALTGSIGIVCSIPITLYVSVALIRRSTIGDAKL